MRQAVSPCDGCGRLSPYIEPPAEDAPTRTGAGPVECPACGGLSLPDHPGGWLGGWQHSLGCRLLLAEDQARQADYQYGRRVRPVSNGEVELLSAFGVAPVTAPRQCEDCAPLPMTFVDQPRSGVALRCWHIADLAAGGNAAA